MNAEESRGASPLLELRNVDKSYRGTKAVSGANLLLGRGEILGLVGENGAGKSTVSGIMSGLTRHDSGELLVEGEPRSFRNPVEAQHAGISRIAQEISLVPQLTVAENVFLGNEQGSQKLRVSRRKLVAQYRELLDELELAGTVFDVDPKARVDQLSIADQQKVEIIRALARRSKVVILDEPTSALGRHEAALLLAMLKRLRDQGLSMIYISHILEDVLAICDEITVMREGRTVASMSAEGSGPADLIDAMLGREMDSLYPAKSRAVDPDETVLEVEGLSSGRSFSNISLTVGAGEIVGLVGLVGSGRSEILRAIFGADRVDEGAVRLYGRPYERRSPRRSIAAGLTMLTESRRDDGMIPEMSVRDNITISSMIEFSTMGVVKRKKEIAVATDLAKKVDVRQRTLSGGHASELSGGNQQKMLFARWLVRQPRVMLIDEPTKGVDIGARAGIYKIITEAAAQGVGVLLVSSEMEEVLELSHRAYVIRGGEIVTELRGDQMNIERAVAASFGQV